MSIRTAEEYPALLTRAVLDAYARYTVSRATHRDRLESEEDQTARVASAATTTELPNSVEEALAPLEVLYGKTALSAIGIALHGAEPVIRYVEQVEEIEKEGASSGDDPAVEDALENHGCLAQLQKARPDAAKRLTLSQQAEQRGRCLYHVGEHTLFSPYYCPCSAYAYQSIQRQEVWCCKHLLALQLALRIEATGLPQDNLRVRVVSSSDYAQLLRRALQLSEIA